ncbi:MAG: hypothetical protein JNL48_11495 [Acidobacteria bacterium]|nr:hypothetical protein [Acidobacteriota bacterium]
MSWVRRHLRAGVAAWLLCHALTFSALVPRDCCAAHAHGARAEAAAEADAACPMHDGAAPAASDCAMAGTCQAPGAALAAVMLQAAVLEPRIDVTLHPEPVVRPRPGAVSPRTLASPPDAPPPRL